MHKRWPGKIVMGGVSGILSTLIVYLFTGWLFEGFFTRFEAVTYDWRVRKMVEAPEKPMENIVIIDIDDRSVGKLGKFHYWPRTYIAKIVKYLHDAGVRSVGIDVIFDRNLRWPQEDNALVESFREAGNVFAALYFDKADSEHFRYAMPAEPAGFEVEKFKIDLPDELTYQLLEYDRLEPDFVELLNAARGVGFVNFLPDADGVLRRIPLFFRFNEHVYPSLALSMALDYLQVEKIKYHPQSSAVTFISSTADSITIPVDRWGRMLIYYYGPFNSFRYISFYDVLMGFVPQEYFQNRIVLIGSSLAGLYDLRATPLQPAFPGVEVNANVLNQILDGRFIRQWSALHQWLFILIVAVIAGFILALLRPLGGILTAILIAFVLLVISFHVLTEYLLWIPLVTPLFALLLTFTSNYIYRYLSEEKDKREIKRIFSHYLAPSVVEVLLKNPEKVRLGGEKKICTVLFSDIAGFTTISEKLPPEELVRLLNEYLTEMTNIILKNDGLLDKYEGDAIMAIFGAPVDIGNHAFKACLSALGMQRRLREIQQEWLNRKLPGLQQRIGINTGPMIVGNMGSQTRFDYTAIGDSVNLGSRLEGANKLYGTEIMISGDTYQMVKDQVVVRPLDLLRVKGKQEPVKVYELVALKDEPLDVKIRQVLNYFQMGFQNYLAQNWEQAMIYFRQALQIKPDDGPSRLYLLRCEEFSANPPGGDWDGVFTLKTK